MFRDIKCRVYIEHLQILHEILLVRQQYEIFLEDENLRLCKKDRFNIGKKST
jgi:hypothetical protein